MLATGISWQAVADLGEGRARARAPPPLFWVKKEEMTEGKMAATASKSRPAPLFYLYIPRPRVLKFPRLQVIERDD